MSRTLRTAREALVAGVVPHATLAAKRSRLHGPGHWVSVARNGERLSEETPGADLHVATLFAALHDTRRKGDGHDLQHGDRARRLAKQLRGDLLSATDEQMEDLEYALYYHADGLTDEDPTIGACWDADRLDLPRCGRKVNPKYLSTQAAKGLLA